MYYSMVGYNYTDTGHMETHICHPKNTSESAIEMFDYLMHDTRKSTYPDAQVLYSISERDFYSWGTIAQVSRDGGYHFIPNKEVKE